MPKEEYTITIEEKGTSEDIEHAIRCVENAEKRADKEWLKKVCAYRREMLIKQLQKLREREKK